jgi:hypothetical protein
MEMNEVREHKSYLLAAAAIIIMFCTYQFVLTPDQRLSLNKSLNDVSRTAPKTMISTMAALPSAIVPTAPATRPTVLPLRTVVPVIKPATVPIGGTLNTGAAPAVAATAVLWPIVGADGCYLATAADGHQFCSDGRALNPSDERTKPGYCSNIKDHDANGNSYGGNVCGNGMPAGLLIGAALAPDEVLAQPEYATAITAAQEAQGRYTFQNDCVTATRPDGTPQTVCNPDPKFPWSDATAAGVAATIIDGTLPATQTKGAHG